MVSKTIPERQTWGSNYRMTEFQAAVGSVQLRRLDQMNDARIAHARARSRILAGAPECLQLPLEPEGYRHVFYLYSLLLPEDAPAEMRDKLIRSLQDRHRVGAVVANPPTYETHRLIREHTTEQCPLPTAQALAARLLCPALHPQMTNEENTRIAAAILESLGALDIEAR